MFLPPHQIDNFGYPVNPKLKKLEFYLGDLVAKYRGAASEERQNVIVQEYHLTMQLLYDAGWDAILDIESELPQTCMFSEYLKRHPHVGKWT